MTTVSEINIDYKQWALDMCVLLDRIEQVCDDDAVEILCKERFALAKKHGIKVEYTGKITGLVQ